MSAHWFVAALLSALLWSSEVRAYRGEEGCDKDPRTSSPIMLETPLGQASGRVCLDDGDSFALGTTFVRIKGIDAPEIGRNCIRDYDQPKCAQFKNAYESFNALSELLRKGAYCRATGTDKWNRWLSECTLPDGTNLAKELIRTGFACARSFEYRLIELDARRREVGLWRLPTRGFPSKQCVVTRLAFKRFLQFQSYIGQRQKSRNLAPPQQNP